MVLITKNQKKIQTCFHLPIAKFCNGFNNKKSEKIPTIVFSLLLSNSAMVLITQNFQTCFYSPICVLLWNRNYFEKFLSLVRRLRLFPFTNEMALIFFALSQLQNSQYQLAKAWVFYQALVFRLKLLTLFNCFKDFSS